MAHLQGRPRFDTRITRLFGIDYPIVQGAMAWLSEAELVAAVSNEGGLGVLGDYRQHPEMVLAHGVRIVFMSAGSAKILTPRIKEAGALCVHVVPNLKLARSAVAAGVDAIVLESHEAGGHVSPDGVTAMTNIPNVARKLDVPLLAAGGIADGHGMAAAMCLGADGIQMGTRFLCTLESNAPYIYQQMLIEAGESDTPVHSTSFHPGRALRSPVVDKLLQMEREGRTVDEIRAFIGRGRARKAAHQSNVEDGIFYAGAGAALVENVISVRELFDEILAQYQEAVARAAGLVVRDGDQTRPVSHFAQRTPMWMLANSGR